MIRSVKRFRHGNTISQRVDLNGWDLIDEFILPVKDKTAEEQRPKPVSPPVPICQRRAERNRAVLSGSGFSIAMSRLQKPSSFGLAPACRSQRNGVWILTVELWKRITASSFLYPGSSVRIQGSVQRHDRKLFFLYRGRPAQDQSPGKNPPALSTVRPASGLSQAGGPLFERFFHPGAQDQDRSADPHLQSLRTARQ